MQWFIYVKVLINCVALFSCKLLFLYYPRRIYLHNRWANWLSKFSFECGPSGHNCLPFKLQLKTWWVLARVHTMMGIWNIVIRLSVANQWNCFVTCADSRNSLLNFERVFQFGIGIGNPFLVRILSIVIQCTSYTFLITTKVIMYPRFVLLTKNWYFKCIYSGF